MSLSAEPDRVPESSVNQRFREHLQQHNLTTDMPACLYCRNREVQSDTKLRRFKDGHYKRIEYLELLGRSDDEEQLPNGDHGYVFGVRIDGELYALKIVRLGIYYLVGN
jgi:hypothetical protein